MGWPGAPNYALIITGGPKAKAGVPTRIGSLVLGAAPAAFGGPFRSAPQTPPGCPMSPFGLGTNCGAAPNGAGEESFETDLGQSLRLKSEKSGPHPSRFSEVSFEKLAVPRIKLGRPDCGTIVPPSPRKESWRLEVPRNQRPAQRRPCCTSQGSLEGDDGDPIGLGSLFRALREPVPGRFKLGLGEDALSFEGEEFVQLARFLIQPFPNDLKLRVRQQLLVVQVHEHLEIA